jgi:hypothetical protein
MVSSSSKNPPNAWTRSTKWISRIQWRTAPAESRSHRFKGLPWRIENRPAWPALTGCHRRCRCRIRCSHHRCCGFALYLARARAPHDRSVVPANGRRRLGATKDVSGRLNVSIVRRHPAQRPSRSVARTPAQSDAFDRLTLQGIFAIHTLNPIGADVFETLRATAGEIVEVEAGQSLRVCRNKDGPPFH